MFTTLVTKYTTHDSGINVPLTFPKTPYPTCHPKTPLPFTLEKSSRSRYLIIHDPKGFCFFFILHSCFLLFFPSRPLETYRQAGAYSGLTSIALERHYFGVAYFPQGSTHVAFRCCCPGGIDTAYT